MRHQRANPDLQAARIAERQHGVASVAQLRAAGLDKDKVKRRVQAGRLHAIHRGVYAVGHRGLSQEGRWMAAVLAGGRGAALSHRSAASLWGLLPARTADRIDVAVPGSGGKRRRAGIRAHRLETLTLTDVTRRHGIPVTTPRRTIYDLRRTAPFPELRRALRQAEVLGLPIGPDPALDRTRSELELRFLSLCRKHHLPPPEVNVHIGPWLVDFLWREQRLIVETDGYRYHRGRIAFEDDRARDLELRALGYDVVRLTYRQVTKNSAEVVAAMRRALAP